MPATQIAQVERYWPTGVARWIYCPTIANINALTRAEINAGTDLTREINSTEGWSTSGEDIETPDGDSDFVGKVPGKTTADDSAIVFYIDPSGVDVRAMFPRGTGGNIVRMLGGDIAGYKYDAFPIRVKSATKLANVGEDEAARLRVQFTITRKPSEDGTIPA